MRFVLSGDLVSAWKTFGCIPLQFTHLVTARHIAVAENAAIAQLYDDRVRTYADELSKFREREADIIKLLQEEGQRIKRDVIRECGITQTFAVSTWKPNKGPGRRQKDNGKGNGCKNKKPRGKGKDHPSNGQWKNETAAGKQDLRLEHQQLGKLRVAERRREAGRRRTFGQTTCGATGVTHEQEKEDVTFALPSRYRKQVLPTVI